MFWVEFVVLHPEVAGCADVVCEMVEISFLGRPEFTSDTVPDFSVLGPGSGCANTFGMHVEAAFFFRRSSSVR